MNASIPAPRSLFGRFVRLVLLTLVSLITLAALAYAFENWRGERAWERTVREHAAKGDPIYGRAELKPIPDAENFAATPLFKDFTDYRALQLPVKKELTGKVKITPKRMMSAQTDFAAFMREPNGRIDLKAWQTLFRESPGFPAPARPGTPADDVLAALHRWDDELTELETASHRPKCQFEIRHDKEGNPIMFHLSTFINASRILEIRCAARLAKDDAEGALSDIEFNERLATAMGKNPDAIDGRVSGSSQTIGTRMFWEGSIDHQWNAQQLARLQTLFAARTPRADRLRALHGERYWQVLNMERLLKESGQFWKDREDWPQFPDRARGLLSIATGRGWVRQNELTVVQHYDTLDRLNETWANGDLPTRSVKFEALTFRPLAYSFLAADAMREQLDDAHSHTDRLACISRMGVLVCALEQFRLANAKYPDSLEALKPIFLATIPLDPCSGKDFHYHAVGDSQFTLYSVGPDGRDDGGEYTNYPDRTDWLWPTTAITPRKLF